MKYEHLQLGDELKLLREFMEANGVTFCITGTFALQMLGAVPPEHSVKDIDVIALSDVEVEREKLNNLFNNLDQLSGGVHDELVRQNCYQNPPFIFGVGNRGIKVNIWVMKNQPEEDVMDVEIESDSYLIHTFRTAMHYKMNLMRQKDFVFQARLIRYITQIGNKDIYNLGAAVHSVKRHSGNQKV